MLFLEINCDFLNKQVSISRCFSYRVGKVKERSVLKTDKLTFILLFNIKWLVFLYPTNVSIRFFHMV